MKIKRILDFCEAFEIDPDALEFYPGWKREIFMCLSYEDWKRCIPQEESFESYDEWQKALESFQEKWFCTGEADNSFNVY